MTPSGAGGGALGASGDESGPLGASGDGGGALPSGDGEDALGASGGDGNGAPAPSGDEEDTLGAPAPRLPAGFRIEGWELDAVIGSGGWGTVYEARSVADGGGEGAAHRRSGTRPACRAR